MAAKFDLSDENVVVIIGSGAGGGTLGTDLALKGINTVILEAGGRHEIEDFVNDEWASFTQLAWTDMRTTSGNWRVAKDFANLPAWIVKAVGGSTTHWAGASLRFQEHEFRTRSVYGDIKGASLLDWPITLKEMEPYYDKAEFRMGVTQRLVSNFIARLERWIQADPRVGPLLRMRAVSTLGSPRHGCLPLRQRSE
jgi:choline dehydrogenase-like flavoprotein